MHKRKRGNYSDPETDSDSDDEYTPSKSPKKKAAAPKKPTTKAEVTIRATDTPLDQLDSQKRLENVNSAVIGKIKKALALANHEGTSEAEARAALRMADKYLQQHNITQADIMAQETEAEQLKRAGISVVSIKYTRPNATAKLESWANSLGVAMRTYFDCQLYTTVFNETTPKVDFSFYGLEEQTVTAALAFETTYNLIMAWSLKPNAGKGVHAKNCYRTGVVYGLIDMANKEKKENLARAKRTEQALLKARQEEEAAEDQSRLNRLKEPEVKIEKNTVEEPDRPVKSEETDVKMEPDRRVKMEEVDDEEDLKHLKYGEDSNPDGDGSDGEEFPFTDSFEVKPDFDDADDVEDLLDLDAERPVLKKSNTMTPPPKVKLEPEEDESSWKSVGALVAFQDTAITVGDNLLKSLGVELVKSRKGKGLEFKDEEARRVYKQGKQDAKKIDVRQKKLKAAGMDD
ncbi:hypothetical protein FB45DRAFT_892950 [Roridomyces roridus]|uniref:DUF2786 domain-containing protein n=1 Tax=Roridomyces roridus TaxID=1738132 RepID=A0AAD7FWK5_9AGAR|nr:hypothetical protein FB45DRAFT_892950 [Roridomyces roridus]